MSPQSTEKMTSPLFHPHLNRYVMALVIAATALSGTYLSYRSFASSNTLYLSPASQTAAIGSSVVVPVRVDTSASSVNAVEVHLSYPTNLLKFVSADNAAGSFPLKASTLNANGFLTIDVSTQGGAPAVSGDLSVVNITFQTLASGTANLGIVSDSMAIDSTTNQNILSTYTGGTITIPRVRGGKSSKTH